MRFIPATLIGWAEICGGILKNFASIATTVLSSTTIELGHASDTTLSRVSAGDIAVEGKGIYRADGTDVPVKDGGTGASTLTDHGILVGSGTDAVTALTVGTNGQVLVGSTGADPVFATITDGEGIDTTLGAGTLTIACEDASTSNKGITVYSGNTKALAGTDTASAMTPADVAAANAVLAREPDQGVAMTYAASGSNGIAVTDDDDIDYGTGNFFGVIPVLLADYTPAAEVVLEQKTDGTNGREFTLQTNGKLRVTINTTDYDSTIATGCTDNTKHVFGYSVTRETAAAAGSIIFVVDGVQLGNAVTITAGAPTTINNAVSQYVLGTSATRTAGTVNGYISGNRALTAAEHLALYRNGIAFADKWGSQTAKYSSNFSAGSDGCGVIGGTITGNIDGIAGYDDVLRFYADGTTGIHALYRTASVIYNKRYKISYEYYIPSTNTNIKSITATVNDNAGGSIGTTLDAWTLSSDFINPISGIANALYFFGRNAAQSATFTGANSITDDLFYIKNVVLTEIGATLALEHEGINETNWQDSSTNNLDATYPTTGWSLTRKVTPSPGGGGDFLVVQVFS